jgi:hypothetical protein
MDDFSSEDQEKLSRFIELSFSLIMRGFDEMEMPQRMELIRLLAFVANLWANTTYTKIGDLERRVRELEKTSKKK